MMSTDFALFRNDMIDIASIDITSKDIVHGFIRKSQRQLPKHNSFYIIPRLVNNLCLSFYFIRVQFNQNENEYGEDMEFENDTIVKNTRTGWRTANILPSISTDCALFKLEITLNHLPNESNYSFTNYNNHFYFGYFTKKIDDTLTWNNWIRHDRNRQHSVGMKIQRNQIIIDSENDQCTSPKMFMSPLNRNFRPGDTCMMIVDFIKKECTFKVNHYDIITLSFKEKTNIIIPAVSLYWQDTEIEITSYSFQ